MSHAEHSKNLNDELTQYARKMLQGLRFGSATSASDLQAAIACIYKDLELKEPRIVTCQSLHELDCMLVLVHICRLQNSLSGMQAVYKVMKKHHLDGEFKVLRESFEQQLLSTDFSLDFGRPLGDELNTYLTRKIYPALTDSLDDQSSSQTRNFIESNLHKQVSEGLWALKNFINSERALHGLEKSMARILHDIARSKAKSSIAENLSDGEIKQRSSSYAPWQFHWLAAYDFAAKFLQTYSPNEAAPGFKNWLMLLDGGLHFTFFENYVFICKHPKSFFVDEADRLHNKSGPAILFADGTKYYAWKGSLVPGWVIEDQHKVTPAIIDSHHNVELRRIMIDIYGFEKYLRKSKLTLLSKDKYGKLYFKDLGGRRHQSIFVVEVLNSTKEPDGSRRRYLLRVPPDMVTAKQAVAWTFRMSEDEYDVDEET